MLKNEFCQRLDSKHSLIGIIGLGYVGLPLLLRCCQAGFKTIGFDCDNNKVNLLSQGKSYINLISDDTIASNLGQFTATTDFSLIQTVDVIVLCLPTPLNKHREPDLSYITNTLKALKPHLKIGQMMCLESTTYPGTTDEELAPILQQCGFNIGEDFYLVYSPEREDPGNGLYRTQTIPKVCGGYTEHCLEVGSYFYSKIIDEVIPVSSTRMAELTKILENIHRAVNIGLVNEMKIVADKMGLDIHEAIRAASTKPFGFVPYLPGPGLGGHCIPIDPFYLTWKAREYGMHTRFIELAGEVNSAMPDYVVTKVVLALNKHEKAIKNSNILVLGIAYKKNVDDMRESPSVIIMKKIKELGAVVAYSDPHILNFPKRRENNFDLTSVNISPEQLSSYDCVILATDHDLFDYDMISQHAKLIVDCRGRYLDHSENIVKA